MTARPDRTEGVLTRRRVLAGGVALGVLAALATRFGRPARAAERYAVMHTDAEWHKLLTDEQYSVLREASTEYPFTSKLLHVQGNGIFSCAGCQQKLFSSATKFDSGTGWPSFWEPLPHAVSSASDATLGMLRQEVHCARCGGHLGHVFDDGPKPTGLRYCMNGVAMTFAATSA